MDPVEFIDAGDDVVVAVRRETGRGEWSGAPLEDPGCLCLRAADGWSSGIVHSRRGAKPSKPWGCGSRRCRRRTWRALTAVYSSGPRRDLDARTPRSRLKSCRRMLPDAEEPGVYRAQTASATWWDDVQMGADIESHSRVAGGVLLLFSARCRRQRASTWRSRRHWGHLCVPRGRQDRVEGSWDQARGPRSRGALGVGDVAGERRALHGELRCRQSGLLVAVSRRARPDLELDRPRSSPERRHTMGRRRESTSRSDSEASDDTRIESTRSSRPGTVVVHPSRTPAR